jgi:hypothetical protein
MGLRCFITKLATALAISVACSSTSFPSFSQVALVLVLLYSAPYFFYSICCTILVLVKFRTSTVIMYKDMNYARLHYLYCTNPVCKCQCRTLQYNPITTCLNVRQWCNRVQVIVNYQIGRPSRHSPPRTSGF